MLQQIFNLWEWILKVFWQYKFQVVILGLDNAGKTSILKVMLGSDFDPQSDYSYKKQNVTLRCWDIGGQVGYRVYWDNFIQSADVIIFVADVTDRARVDAGKEELGKIASKFRKVPILVLANKVDLLESKGIDVQQHLVTFEQQLGIRHLRTNLPADGERPGRIGYLPVSALTGEGIERIGNWLISELTGIFSK